MTKNPGPAAAVISAFILLTSSFSHAAVWYVDIDNASGTEDGTPWAMAFTTIQPAVHAEWTTSATAASAKYGAWKCSGFA